MSEDNKQLLQDAFDSQPNWHKENTKQTKWTPPKSLHAGRVVIELDTKRTPKTAENFRALCTGEKGTSKSNRSKNLHYKGTKFHRIIKDFMCQGGDIIFEDGRGGESIYGKKFQDEKQGLNILHERGVVSMANSGKNSNTSQFFFVFGEQKQLNKKHVVFGKIIDGLDVLDEINSRAASNDGTPLTPVVITDCGQC